MGDIAFFDEVAERWDAMARHPERKLTHILDTLGYMAGKRALDVGTGTGVLVPALCERVGPRGFVSAVDLSANMIAVARRKFSLGNAEFVHGDFCEFRPVAPYDAVVAYSCYPHFHDKERFFRSVLSCLNPEGLLLIAHSQSKEEINGIHRRVEGRVRYGGLAPVGELSALAAGYGFAELRAEDSAEYYLYLGKKQA